MLPQILTPLSFLADPLRCLSSHSSRSRILPSDASPSAFARPRLLLLPLPTLTLRPPCRASSRSRPPPVLTAALRTKQAHSIQPTPSDTAPSPQPLPHRPRPSLTRLPALAQPNLQAATPDSSPIKARLLCGVTNQRKARTGSRVRLRWPALLRGGGWPLVAEGRECNLMSPFL